MFEKIKETLGWTSIPNEDLRKPTKKIPWDHIFLLEAVLWSSRSIDAQTQCGCVLVRDKTVLSTGYNGFIRDIDDTLLPNLRPYKYPFMIHAEHNAILNCARLGIPTQGATAYVTGLPCNNCLQFMYQSGIVRVVHGDKEAHMCENSETYSVRSILYALMNRATNINPTFTPPPRFTIQQISYSDINFPEIFDKTITRSIE